MVTVQSLPMRSLLRSKLLGNGLGNRLRRNLDFRLAASRNSDQRAGSVAHAIVAYGATMSRPSPTCSGAPMTSSDAFLDCRTNTGPASPRANWINQSGRGFISSNTAVMLAR